MKNHLSKFAIFGGLATPEKLHVGSPNFDAAHAFRCSLRGQMIGNFGNAKVFNFNATKFCNSFAGGAIVTNDSELAKKIRLMKNFDFRNYHSLEFIGINGLEERSICRYGGDIT